MSPSTVPPVGSRAFWFTATLLALAAIPVLIVLGWLRFLAPARRPWRVRDL